MNTRKVTFTIMIVMLFAVAVTAQENNDRQMPQQQMQGMMGQGGMMGNMIGQGGMMSGMMGSGMMNGCMVGSMMGNMMNSGKMGAPNLYLQFEEELGLSSQQVASLKKIRLDFAKNTADNNSQLQIATLELQDLLEMDSVNILNVEFKINDIHKSQAKNQLAAVRAGIDAKKVLNPEQLDKAKNLMGQRGMSGQQQGSASALQHSGGMMR